MKTGNYKTSKNFKFIEIRNQISNIVGSLNKDFID